jgi:DNA-binding GntR family transcriptional regulator
MTTLHLSVDRDIDVPIHRQVREGLRRAILEGRLRPGQRIPSTRSLAADLGVSRLPVLSAYEQLLHEGYLIGRTGSGTFVSNPCPTTCCVLFARTLTRRGTTPKSESAGVSPSVSSGWNFLWCHSRLPAGARSVPARSVEEDRRSAVER